MSQYPYVENNCNNIWVLMGKTRLSCSLRENGRSMSQKYLLMAWISLSLSLFCFIAIHLEFGLNVFFTDMRNKKQEAVKHTHLSRIFSALFLYHTYTPLAPSEWWLYVGYKDLKL